ncbi:cupin domain-containing protein [Streptomyces sp. NBC_00868]|uniref:cupin domain-containing protein n=1 Tax=Streptomyces sp. NBC_00868 TaxID=2903683 RepID=UPI00386CAA74|nr:cupin domain-containing protein [Streptomyces sp. NBC_00868]
METITHQENGASIAQSHTGLARLIAPLDIATFQNEFFEKKPLLIRRENREYYADLLTLDNVDEILSLSSLQNEDVRVAAEGSIVSLDDRLAFGAHGSTNAQEAVYASYRDGATIIMDGLHHRWAPLQRLVQAIGAETNAKFQVNTYLTPGGGAQGFKPHQDNHDVFVAQAHGVKRWALYGPRFELPLKHMNHQIPVEQYGEPVHEFDLHPGDLLYLPRGTVHAARSTDTASLHLTFGARPVLRSTLLMEAIEQVITADVRFRRGLPLGFVSDKELSRQAEEDLAGLIGALAERLSAAGMLESAITQAISINAPELRNHLTDLERLDSMDLDTGVSRRSDIRWDMRKSDKSVQLHFHNKIVELPVHVADEVRFAAEGTEPSFTARTLPGQLDDSGRLVLIRTLVREGFLTFA